MNDVHDYSIDYNSCIIEAEENFQLVVFGDELARRNGYKVHRGLDAVKFYLLGKYHWTLAYVNSLALQDIRFLLLEEMHNWTLPEKAVRERALSAASKL
jgi:hypothetical protein